MSSWAIICGWSVPAYSIIHSLRSIGWRGRPVCFKDRFDGPVLVENIRPKVQIVEANLQTPIDMIGFIKDNFPAADKKNVFFIDERFHRAFRDELENPTLENTEYCIGSSTHLESILDRYLFYRFIADHQAGPVPKTISSQENPWEILGNEFLIRPRMTWKGLQRLERVQFIRSRSELKTVVDRWRSQGMNDSDWCFQELLSVSPQDNISISGWHDEKNRLYFTTRHILRHPTEVGNGDVTELIESPPGLKTRTKTILDALNYNGPFELEFLLDKRDGTYKPIEMNPRFWMQHGLLEQITNHELVRRYLGMEVTEPANVNTIDKKYWVYTFYSIFRILRADKRIIPFIRNARVVYEPSITASLKWVLGYPMHNYISRKGRH